MTLPDLAIVLACYALFWIARIRFIARGLRAPFFRGKGWLFDSRLRDEAASNDNVSEIVHAYWLRMALPFAVDVPILWAIFEGRYVVSVLLILVGCAIQEVNHVASVRAATRRAVREGLASSHEPSRALALSLKPRRLRDYVVPHIELTIAACNLVALAWLGLIERRLGAPRGLWALYGIPIFLLYVQAGAILAKLIAIEWRDPLPAESAKLAASASEALRVHRAKAWDVMRAGAALSMLFWPIKVAIREGEAAYAVAIFFAVAVVVAMGVLLRREHRRRELDVLVSGTPPAPALQTPTRQWPICLVPASPLPLLPSERGWSINIAHRHAQAVVVYLVGLATLATRLALG